MPLIEHLKSHLPAEVAMFLLLWASTSWGQGLTQAQLATLKTDVTVTRAAQFATELANNDYQGIANWYNLLASPTANLWRPDVTVKELNTAIDWVAFIALDVQHQQGYMAMTQSGFVDTTAQLVRKGFGDIFGAGSTTATNLLAVVLKPGTNGQVLFSTTAGQGRVSQIYGYSITYLDVAAALRLP